MKTITTLIILTSVLLLTSSAYRSTNDANGYVKNSVLHNGTKTLHAISTDGAIDNKEVSASTNINLFTPVQPISPIDAAYLRFDVNKYINISMENNELPEAEEFNYIKFDVNEFIEENPGDIMELPVSEFDYLRFDINKFIDTSVADEIFELPVTE
jgi:hypothetical protein